MEQQQRVERGVGGSEAVRGRAATRWWGHLDSNQEPTDYESAALTVELWPQLIRISSGCSLLADSIFRDGVVSYQFLHCPRVHASQHHTLARRGAGPACALTVPGGPSARLHGRAFMLAG